MMGEADVTGASDFTIVNPSQSGGAVSLRQPHHGTPNVQDAETENRENGLGAGMPYGDYLTTVQASHQPLADVANEGKGGDVIGSHMLDK